MPTLSMPSTALPYPTGTPLPWRTLGGLTLAVVLAHWMLLGGLTSLLPNWTAGGRLAGSPNLDAFITRTIFPAPTEERTPAAEPSVEPATEVLAPPVRAEPLRVDDIAQLSPMAEVSFPSPMPFGEEGDEAYGIAGLTDDATPLGLVIPNPTRLEYDVKGEIKGIPYSAKAEMVWKHDGKNYDARLQISHWIASRTQTSKGALTPSGLEPLRFGDKVRSEVAAHFEREKGKVSFSANTPDAPLTAGAQDQLSVFVQLAALFGGNPERLVPGISMSFQAVGPRSSERWIFKVGATETLKLPGGEISCIKVIRDPANENDARAELWLAPNFGYLPVRIRLTQGNSDFVDQLWRSTQIP